MTITEMIARQSEITTLARSENRDLTEDETREFNELQAKIDAAKPATPATGSPSPDPAGGDDAVQRAVAAERQRVSDITKLCRTFGLDPKPYTEQDMSVDDCR